jgi:hypothetical protein
MITKIEQKTKPTFKGFLSAMLILWAVVALDLLSSLTTLIAAIPVAVWVSVNSLAQVVSEFFKDLKS